MAPTNNRGMTYQTNKKHLTNLTEYFVGGFNIAFNYYTRCAWAGGTESQFVVERKFICELHNTSLKFNIRVKIL